MRKITSLFCALVLLILAGEKVTAQGGPDAFGYTWIRSIDPGGPAYNWIDITSRSGVQTVTGLADDNSAAGMINIGFSFHYYWTDETMLKVGSNGWLSFTNVGNIASCFPSIPTAGGAADNYLSPHMSDLNFTGAGNPGQVKYWTNSVDSFIISYINVPYWSVSAPGWTGGNNFQVILCKNDSSITFQYGNLSGLPTNAACVDFVAGIENSTGSIGLQVYNDAAPPANSVIRFDAPAVPLISIQDVLPQWNFNPDNAGVIVVKDASIALHSNIRNGGNANVTVPITMDATIRNSASTAVHTSSGSLPSLMSNEDTLYSFTPWIPTATGSYSYEVVTTCSQDINANNNTNSIEMQVVDFCSPTTTLGYVSSAVPNGSLNWNGGDTDEGAAVYFEPPVYPYTISELQYFIVSNVSDGFIAAVYDDDGPNGTQGTLLFTTTVGAGSVITNAWNTVPVNPGITLNNGGYYVAWFQTGTSIFLGTQTTGPFSRRCFEILAGSWAQYRQAYNTDLYIRSVIGNYTTQPVAAYSSAYTSAYTYAFTDATTGPVATWQWDFGDGNTSTLQNPTHTFAGENSYNVCLVTTSSCGDDDTICQTINACAAPAIAQQPLGGTLCEEDTITISVTATGTALVYQWQENAGSGFADLSSSALYAGVATSTLSITGAVPSISGYTYRCIITGSCGNVTSDTVSVTVNSLPAVTLGSLTDMCISAGAVTLTGAPAGGTYSGPGVSGGSFDPASAGAGMHTLSYVYTDGNACIDTARVSVSVNALPVVTLSVPVTTCSNTSAFALTGGAPAGGVYSGTGVNAGNFDPSVGAGTYTITYVYTDVNGCTDSAAASVVVNAAPVVTLGSLSDVCVNYPAFALSGGSPAGGTYTGTGVSGGNFDPSVAGAGTFTITYTYSDANSCLDSAQQSILVDPCVGLDKTESAEINYRVYPNPASEEVTLQTDLHNVHLDIYDALGNHVRSEVLTGHDTRIDMRELSPGIYVFRLSATPGTSIIKVVKE